MVKQSTSVTCLQTSELSDHVVSDTRPDVLALDNISVRANGSEEEQRNNEVCGFLHRTSSDGEHSAPKDYVMISSSEHVPLAKVRGEFDDILDDIVLGERRKMLISSISAVKGAHLVKQSILPKTSELSDHEFSASCPNALHLDVISGVSPVKYDLERMPKLSGIYANKERPKEASVNDLEEEQQNNTVYNFLYRTSPEDDHSASENSLEISTIAHGPQSKTSDDTLYKFDESLDDILLGERRRMLASRKLMQSSESHLMTLQPSACEGLLNSSAAVMPNAGIQKDKSDYIQNKIIAKDMNTLASVYDQQDPKCGSDRANRESCSSYLPSLGDINTFETRASPTSAKFVSNETQGVLPTGAESMASSVLLSHLQVKSEPVDNIELCNEGEKTVNFRNNTEMLTVKTEPASSDYFEDALDHLPLIDRVELLSSGRSDVSMSHSAEHFKEDVDVTPDILDSVKTINLIRSRKRKRTATNSLETALEEDAPGLLKVLTERGVSIEEIKLYGEDESDADFDESVIEESFSELEAVISQLFSHRQTFLKFPLLHSKGAKINYCLSCLLSLVEQTRYLRNRKWPVEWGWCRDLQSFIFVFQRHNRIVLERPEYGFATYFFELLNSVPVAWQIKRLVTAMKLTSCGRITLIENKPLMVGEDLSEDEARILADFGWTPNTGLGTMLNYCDRVVHDRKQDMDSFEWRSKIGRQLMNGFNGGYIVSTNIPKKLIDCESSQDVQVKMEY